MMPPEFLGPDWKPKALPADYIHYEYRGNRAVLQSFQIMVRATRPDVYYLYRTEPILKFYPADLRGLNADELKAQLAVVLLTDGATQ